MLVERVTTQTISLAPTLWTPVPAKRAVVILRRCGPRRRRGRQRLAATRRPTRRVGQQAATALHPSPSRSLPRPLTSRAPNHPFPCGRTSHLQCECLVLLVGSTSGHCPQSHSPRPPSQRSWTSRPRTHTRKPASSCGRRSGTEAVDTTAHIPPQGQGGQKGARREGGGSRAFQRWPAVGLAAAVGCQAETVSLGTLSRGD